MVKKLITDIKMESQLYRCTENGLLQTMKIIFIHHIENFGKSFLNFFFSQACLI